MAKKRGKKKMQKKGRSPALQGASPANSRAYGELTGSRVVFWCIAPVLALAALGTPFLVMLVEGWTWANGLFSALVSLTLIGLIALFYHPRRFWWVLRAMMLELALVCIGVGVYTFVAPDQDGSWVTLILLVLFATGFVWYAIRGHIPEWLENL